MKAIFPSTLAMRETSRIATSRLQTAMVRAQTEVSTGRHADVGLALGVTVTGSLSARQLDADLEALSQTNAVVAQRYNHTEAALDVAIDLAQGLVKQTLAAINGTVSGELLVADAQSRLRALQDVLSTTSNGAYVFSGINSANAPLQDYLSDPPGAPRNAVVAAFTAAFGYAPDDPAVRVEITAAEMDTYLGGTFASLFQDPSWKTSFSTASDEPLRDRIGLNNTIEQPVTANHEGFRLLVAALTGIVDGGTQYLGAQAYEKLARGVLALAGSASAKLVEAQSELGLAQEGLAKATERITLQREAIAKRIGEYEGVDTFEATTRLNTLVTQLETSYAVTARLQQISLLNYL
jgi:flagellar hook-associated protein 3 FlgL